MSNVNVIGKQRLGKDVAVFQRGKFFDVFWGKGFNNHAKFEKGIKGQVITMAQVAGDTVPAHVYPQINEVL